MNGGVNAFGSGNRANATIGRAIRLVLLNVGGGTPGDLDKSTLGHPGKYTYGVAENEADSPFAPYHVEKGFAPDDSTVFVIAAEPPHSVTNHVADDPEGILDSICSAMTTIANNNAVSSGHCAVVIGPEHARTIAAKGWTRHDVRSYLHMNAWNLFGDLAFDHRYGNIYNRNLPRWYKRDPDARIPIVPSPDHIHLFVIGGAAGRFSAFIPGWGHMSSPVLRAIEGAADPAPVCVDGTCYLVLVNITGTAGLRASHGGRERPRSQGEFCGAMRSERISRGVRPAGAGRGGAGGVGAAGGGARRAAGSACSTTRNGMPTGCCARPPRGWARSTASRRSTTTRRKASRNPPTRR